MPGNNQSFDVDAYLRYIFGEENEPEQVGEQELHWSVQAPWLIGSDIGITVLGSTIDILQRRCDEQFAIHRAKDPELLGGMIDDPPEEPPSPVLIESLMPQMESYLDRVLGNPVIKSMPSLSHFHSGIGIGCSNPASF